MEPSSREDLSPDTLSPPGAAEEHLPVPSFPSCPEARLAASPQVGTVPGTLGSAQAISLRESEARSPLQGVASFTPPGVPFGDRGLLLASLQLWDRDGPGCRAPPSLIRREAEAYLALVPPFQPAALVDWGGAAGPSGRRGCTQSGPREGCAYPECCCWQAEGVFPPHLQGSELTSTHPRPRVSQNAEAGAVKMGTLLPFSSVFSPLCRKSWVLEQLVKADEQHGSAGSQREAREEIAGDAGWEPFVTRQPGSASAGGHSSRLPGGGSARGGEGGWPRPSLRRGD